MYEVLYVGRETIDAKISNTIRSRSVIDLIMREKESGLICLWEHKSTKNVPDSGLRLRDLQTLLYATVAKRKYNLDVDKVVWNYLRTKLPMQPHQNKPDKYGVAAMSKAVGIDTTWEIYQQALVDAGLDPEDYQDVRSRLYNAEYDKYYPRYEHVIVARLGCSYGTTSYRHDAPKRWSAAGPQADSAPYDTSQRTACGVRSSRYVRPR